MNVACGPGLIRSSQGPGVTASLNVINTVECTATKLSSLLSQFNIGELDSFEAFFCV